MGPPDRLPRSLAGGDHAADGGLRPGPARGRAGKRSSPTTSATGRPGRSSPRARALTTSAPNPDSARARLGQGDRRVGPLRFPPLRLSPLVRGRLRLLVPLGYDGAKVAWFALNLELLLLAGYLLRDAVPGVPRSVPLVAVPLFGLSVVALFVGQTSIVMLFLTALAWKLMARGNDRLAGAALACLTTKPQLTAVLVLALLDLECAATAVGGRARVRGDPGRPGPPGCLDRPGLADRDAAGGRAHPAADGLFPLDRHHLAAGAQTAGLPRGGSGDSTWQPPCRSSQCSSEPRSIGRGPWKISCPWA